MRSGEISRLIISVVGAAGIILTLATLPGIAPGIVLFEKIAGKNKTQVRNSFYNLKKKGYLKYIEDEKTAKIYLTKKGLELFRRYGFENLKMAVNKKWDGKWSVVTFDIPERLKKARNSISWKLKDLGFYPLQKSIFVYPYECKDEIDFVGDYFFARKHIYIIGADKIEREDTIKKHFKLS